jgi:hypothetical protein
MSAIQNLIDANERAAREDLAREMSPLGRNLFNFAADLSRATAAVSVAPSCNPASRDICVESESDEVPVAR